MARKKATKAKREQPAGPGEFVSAGMAYRRVPVIETMLKRGQLSAIEWLALSYYRDQASIADRSETKSCLDRSVSSINGNGPGAAVRSARVETGRIERDLGSLQPIARAIAVEDKSLTEWCIAQHGGRERRDKDGRVIAMVPVGRDERGESRINMALLDLKMAAGRIVR